MTTRREFWLALCGAAGLRAQDTPVFTALAQDVPVDTAVTRSQRPVTGLRLEDFVLLDDGESRTIRSVTTEELPLDLVLISFTIPSEVPKEGIPLADSMRARLLNGAANVLLLTRPEDRVAFLTHTDPVGIELPFTNDHDAMGAALRRIGAMEYSQGFSELLTIEYAVRMFAELGPAPGRRRLIVRLGTILGAGLGYADEPVIRRLWSENIIYSSIAITSGSGCVPTCGIGFLSEEPDGPLYRLNNPYHIADATGGDAITFLNPRNPRDLITRMRQRYVLWFAQPADLEPGQQRSLSVDLSPEARRRYPDAVVQARSGYVSR